MEENVLPLVYRVRLCKNSRSMVVKICKFKARSLLLASVCFSANIFSKDNELYVFKIPSQRADISLIQFAEQVDLTLLFPQDSAFDKQANRLIGEFSIQSGLNVLLNETGLRGQLKENGQLVIFEEDNSETNDNMLNFNKNKVGAAIVAIISGSLISQTAIAQDAESNAQDNEIEVIQVSGFKNSLIKAQALKRDSTSVVEAITAEDIGKLPDSSIAESLARLPGLAGERRNGRTSGLSVRGFKEDYVGTTMNGRELLGIGDNRGVEYDLYPSEIISGAVVHKTSDASLPVTGIGGTVDLQTIRPLNAEENVTLNAIYESNGMDSNNPDYDSEGYRLAFAANGKFADDKIGLAVAIASTESPNQEENMGMWGYGYKGDDDFETPNGGFAFSRSSVLRRDTISTVLQFKPNDDLDIVVDGLYIDFEDDMVMRGMMEGFNGHTNVTVEDGLAVAGTHNPSHSYLRSDANLRTGELKTLGLNIDYQVNDKLKVGFDVSRSETEKSDYNAEGYAGVGRGGSYFQGDATVRDWVLTDKGINYQNSNIDFSDYNEVLVAGPQLWGGSLAPVEIFQNAEQLGAPTPSQLSDSDRIALQAEYAAASERPHPDTFEQYLKDKYAPKYNAAQDGFINEAVFEEQLTSIRLDGTYTFDDGFVTAVTAGVHYSDRSKSKYNRGWYGTAPSFPYVGDTVPEQYRVGLADLNWIGLGDIAAFDVYSMYQDGYYVLTDSMNLQPDRIGDTYTIDETVTTLFTKVDFAKDIADYYVSGNIGGQYIKTKQSSSSAFGTIGADLYVEATPLVSDISYSNFLPSININVDLNNDHIVRFAASKTISRARFDYLKAGGAVKFEPNYDVLVNDTESRGDGPWQANSGNPTLKPLESNNFDLSWEWYPAADMYLAAAFFYKDLVNWHRAGVADFDFEPYYIEGYHQATDSVSGEVVTPKYFDGYTSLREDGLTGSINGIELQASIPLNTIASFLDGFGIVASAAFNDGELDNGDAIPGMSDESYQATIYYENNGFEVRVAATKRSDYESEQRGGSNSLVPVNRLGVTLVDAQISYDFSQSEVDLLKGLKVSLQAQNITDEDEVNADQLDPRKVYNYSNYGPNYLLGINYSF